MITYLLHPADLNHRYKCKLINEIAEVKSDILLNKAKSARGPLELVQPHHHPLHLTTLAKELVDLLLCCVETHVAHVERGALTQKYKGKYRVVFF